jgi:hypothetical protein
MATEKEQEQRDETIDQFKQAVNMTAKQLESWLDTEESQRVGYKENGKGESTGHESGRMIVKILGKKQNEYTDDDLQQMRRTVSYVHRHLAQRPDGDITDTRWRYSLMNWGHDPLK